MLCLCTFYIWDILGLGHFVLGQFAGVPLYQLRKGKESIGCFLDYKAKENSKIPCEVRTFLKADGLDHYTKIVCVIIHAGLNSD
jgi:hypothetical protein